MDAYNTKPVVLAKPDGRLAVALQMAVQTVQYLRSQRPTSITPGSVPTLSNSELSVSTASDPPVSSEPA